MGLVCAHRIASPITSPITAYSAVTSIYLHLVLLFFIARRTPLAVSSERASPMDKLPYNVHPGLPRDEFVQNLKHLPAWELNTLRFDLFCVAYNTHSLLAPEWSDIPLVTRKDTAIKSASHKISEDIWTIVSCIKNKQRIPRVLLRNGKRGKEFLARHPPTQSPSSRPISQPLNTDESQSRATHDSITPNPPVQPPISCPSHVDPPSSREVASFFISREINNLKDEMRSMKSDIAFLLHKSNEATDVSLANNMVGKELLSIKRELSCLREAMSLNCTSTVEVEVPDVLAAQKHSNTIHTTHNQLVITSWNCRGYKNALPYINHLLESGSDVIALSEHWMWPFEIPELCHIHPDYTGFGRADKRLHDQSALSRGCGGVGLLWKKSIQTSLIEIDSDRICGIQIELEDCLLSVLSVYLPCSGQNLAVMLRNSSPLSVHSSPVVP